MLAAHVQSERAEALARGAKQLADALDRVHLKAECREDRALVTGTGANFQHLLRLRAIGEQCLGHARHHPGLGNGLAMADRQRGVLVGTRGEGLIDEQVPRYGTDGVEHALVADRGGLLGAGTQPFDQPVAHALRGHADADCLGLQAQARDHADAPLSSSSSPPTQLATCSSAW